MFSYYGSKAKLVNYYPPPRHGRIVEPFAGSARYSLKYFENDVLLIDKYEIIIQIWEYLQQCSPADIMGLPNLKHGDKIDREKFDCIEQAYLFGFLIKRGSRSPDLTVSRWGEVEIQRGKKRIAEHLYKIRHWKFVCGDYSIAENIPATWFIDPPYKDAGRTYRHSSKRIDFDKLGVWCKERKGQVIVCESASADWLPFVPMKTMNGLKYSTTDGIWSNLETSFDYQQAKLF